jgi:YegS/Rv2252/BmrU family lipid kinase
VQLYRIIVNPASGNGNALKALPMVEAYLREKGIAYEVCLTEAPDHATMLAREAADAKRLGVIAMGGDGTMREIAAGLTGGETPILILPCGTGNDLRKSMRLPKDPLAALALQLSGKDQAIDVGHLGAHVFVNASGTGFDVEVLKNTLKYTARFKGLLPYLLGIFSAIRAYKPIEIELCIRDAVIKKKMTLIEIANGQYIGGGMRVAPTADLKDGHFDIYYIDALSRPMIVFLLPFFVGGWYRHFWFTHVLHADALTIRSDHMTVNVDGDLVESNEARYRLTPLSLHTKA